MLLTTGSIHSWSRVLQAASTWGHNVKLSTWSWLSLMAAAQLRQRTVPLTVQEDEAHRQRLWMLFKDAPCLFLWEEMHCRHRTDQNKPNVSCLQWSVVTLWVPGFHGYHVGIKLTRYWRSCRYKKKNSVVLWTLCTKLHMLRVYGRQWKYRRRYAMHTRAATALHPPVLTSKQARAVPVSAILF